MGDQTALRVGVMGHRRLAEMDRIVAGIDGALAQVVRAFPDRPLIVVSALAEGADRLVAERALAHPGARLRVALPLDPADYEQDFATPESRASFRALLALDPHPAIMPPATTRTAAYAAVGQYVLDNADVLVVGWDGRAALGEGGTGEIVALARERALPIAWVHAGNRDPATNAPTSLGNEQGRVTYEGRWPHPEEVPSG